MNAASLAISLLGRKPNSNRKRLYRVHTGPTPVQAVAERLARACFHVTVVLSAGLVPIKPDTPHKRYPWSLGIGTKTLTSEAVGEGMVIGELNPNERVEVLDSRTYGVKIKTKAGVVGWVYPPSWLTTVDPAHVCKEHPVTATDWKDCGAN